MFENKKVGLALSGGGAKGASHIGVLQALKEAGVDIFAISGTSSGSIVATLYASGYSPYQILKLFKIYSNQIINLDSKVLIKMFTKSFGNRSNFASIASGINLESVIKMNLKYKNITSIKDIKMPIIIPCVELDYGKICYFSNIDEVECYEEEWINYGNISKIVRASCSFPGIFDPVIYNNKILADGGLRMNVPVTILKKAGCDIVIAVSFEKDFEKIKNLEIFRIGIRCIDIMGKEISKKEINEANYLISPNIGNTGLLDFNMIDYIVNQGYNSAKMFLEKIK